MSTRSIVAVPYGDSWRGRHVQSDGYPTWQGRELWALVKRDGLERVRQVITEEHYGWSSLRNTQPDLTSVKIPKDYNSALKYGYGTPEYEAFNLSPSGSLGDGRFANVPGYGIAYTDTVINKLMGNGKPYQQTTEDHWLDPECTNDTEWAYVLGTGELWIYVCHMTWGAQEPIPPSLVATCRWDAPEPDWKRSSAS